MIGNILCRAVIRVSPPSSALARYQSAIKTMKIQLSTPNSIIRSFKTDATMKASERQFVRRAKEKLGIKERAMQPTSGTPFQIGQGAVAGAAIFGLGALCYYGLGLSSDPGVLERSMLWPKYVRERIHSTYMYFGGSIAITAASMAAAFRSPALMNLMARSSWVVMIGSLVALVGTGMVVQSIPYSPGFGAKQLGWMLHSGVMGIVLAPMCVLGGPLLMRAAVLTAGIVGGLSTVAVCAPSEKFLNMGGPLAIGLGVVFASSLASMFLPPTTALGAGLFSISLYGGLILFSGFLLYDTQKIVKRAETHPENSVYLYDPVNASISIYLDTMNIFIRIVQMLAMSGAGRKK